MTLLKIDFINPARSFKERCGLEYGISEKYHSFQHKITSSVSKEYKIETSSDGEERYSEVRGNSPNCSHILRYSKNNRLSVF